jgi:nitroreductase
VRWFRQQQVDRSLVDQALRVAVEAPSSCNRQPVRFRFFEGAEAVQRIAQLAPGTAGFAHNIPLLAVIIGDLSAYFAERDRHGIYIDASLAAMSFMLALETLGLSSCSLNWPDVAWRERKMVRALGLRAHERVIMLMAIGHPDPNGLVAHSQKRSPEQLRSYEAGSPVPEQKASTTRGADR